MDSDLNTLITFKSNSINTYIKSIGIFLANDKFLLKEPKRLDIFYGNRVELDLEGMFSIFFSARILLVKGLDFQFLKRV